MAWLVLGLLVGTKHQPWPRQSSAAPWLGAFRQASPCPPARTGEGGADGTVPNPPTTLLIKECSSHIRLLAMISGTFLKSGLLDDLRSRIALWAWVLPHMGGFGM